MLTLFAGLSAAASAYAQDDDQPRRPPVEIGIGIDKISTYSYSGEVGLEGFDSPAVSVRGTFPFTARYAIEGIVSFERRDQRYPGRTWATEMTEVMYAIQIKRGRRQPHQQVHTFATFGVAGAMYHSVRPERKVGLPGSEQLITRSVDQTVYPPVAALLGGGLQYDFPRHVAFRAEAQVAMLLYLPVAARVSASLAIPFGSYSRRLVLADDATFSPSNIGQAADRAAHRWRAVEDRHRRGGCR